MHFLIPRVIGENDRTPQTPLICNIYLAGKSRCPNSCSSRNHWIQVLWISAIWEGTKPGYWHWAGCLFFRLFSKMRANEDGEDGWIVRTYIPALVNTLKFSSCFWMLLPSPTGPEKDFSSWNRPMFELFLCRSIASTIWRNRCLKCRPFSGLKLDLTWLS